MKQIKFGLNEIADGDVQEKFTKEFKKVLNNILDESTDYNAKRDINIKISFETSEDRTALGTTVNIKSTLAPQSKSETTLLISEDDLQNITVGELKSGTPGQTYIDKDGNTRTDTGELID